MEPYEKILLQNLAWSKEMVEDDPEYFNRLKNTQTPQFLWIGCSDSRVAVDAVTGTSPGEVFVHRNIANMVVHTDLNMLSVLEYAVRHLKVSHVIVCGHYGCGGVKAALSRHDYGLINKWLRNIKDLYYTHKEEILAISGEEQQTDRMVELNVIEQVMNLAKTSIVQKAWKSDHPPHLHGWVYGLKDGKLKSMIHLRPGDFVDELYEYDNL